MWYKARSGKEIKYGVRESRRASPQGGKTSLPQPHLVNGIDLAIFVDVLVHQVEDAVTVDIFVDQVRPAIAVCVLVHKVDLAVLVDILMNQISFTVAIHVLMNQIHHAVACEQRGSNLRSMIQFLMGWNCFVRSTR